RGDKAAFSRRDARDALEGPQALGGRCAPLRADPFFDHLRDPLSRCVEEPLRHRGDLAVRRGWIRTRRAVPADVDLVHGAAAVRGETIGAIRVADHRKFHVGRGELRHLACGDPEHGLALEILSVTAVELRAEIRALRPGDEIDAWHAEVPRARLRLHEDPPDLLRW